jgi:hypothetical protein
MVKTRRLKEDGCRASGGGEMVGVSRCKEQIVFRWKVRRGKKEREEGEKGGHYILIAFP